MRAEPASSQHCQGCQAEVERGDLRCAICGTQVPRMEESRPDGLQVEIMRCDGCGAAVSYDVEAKAPRCSFCASVMHVEQVEDPMEQTGWWGDFGVSAEQAHGALAKWLGGLGFLRPSDLSRNASIEALKPLWWVGWVFDATALVSWTADSDAGSRSSAWAPHAGQTELSFDRIMVAASRGLDERETSALRAGYDLGVGGDKAPSLEGSTVEQFDVQRSEARGRIIDIASAVAANRVQAGHIPGSRFRNVQVELVLRGLRTRRCAFPAYVLAYRYRGKLYRAVVNGQDSDFVTGKAPYSIWKIAGLVTLGVAVLAALAFALTS